MTFAVERLDQLTPSGHEVALELGSDPFGHRSDDEICRLGGEQRGDSFVHDLRITRRS